MKVRFLLAVTALLFFACDASAPRVARIDDGVLRIVVLGDSVAHGAGDERVGGITRALRSALPVASVVNLGVNGARTTNVLALLSHRDSDVARADVVILSIGGNDLYGDSIARVLSRAVPAIQQSRVARRVESVIDRIHTINANARVVVLGLYNPYRGNTWLDEQVNRWDARLIKRFAADRRVTIIRICDLLDRDER
ncbi:MAG: GDSL-type esterase/lipase family protein, partial [Thermoanaerobaculia bacterium]